MRNLRIKLDFDWQSWIAFSLLCLWLLITMGLPVNLQVSKDLSIAFPCQSHGCGCRDAASCWNNCCCHSFQYRKQWAIDHDVTPPDSFWLQEATTKNHANKLESSGVEVLISKNSSNCQSAGSCCAKKKTSSKTKNNENFSSKVILNWDAAKKCRGAEQYWVMLTTAYTENSPRWTVNLVPIGSLNSLSASWRELYFPPPNPPPISIL